MNVSCCSVEQGIDSQGQTCELCFPLTAPGGIDGQMVQGASDANSSECLSSEQKGGRNEAAEL